MPEDKKKPDVVINLSDDEKKQMREDMERITYFKEYRRPFEKQMELGAKAANMIADPSPRDDISNLYIGIARMIGESAISAMNEGRPGFGFRPGASSDVKKIPFWEAGIEHIMDKSNFDSKQHMFLTDFTYLNMGVYEVAQQFPIRKVRMPIDDGKFETLTKRDHRRSKVEIRHRNPFEVWLDPTAPNLQEVRTTYDEKYLTEDEFKHTYRDAVVFDSKGNKKPRYSNIEHVKAGYALEFAGHDNLMYRDLDNKYKVVVGRLQDEDNDIYREYANGVPIFDGALQSKELPDGRRTVGANVLGVHTFCFGPNEHQYDANMRTSALYPMGLPFTMRGFDTLYQALTNMQIDNWRLSNTMAISYKPFDGASQLDLDARDFYSGDFIDGEIGVHPFGQARTGEYQAMIDILDNWCIYLTGVNFKQLFGDTSKTAFELSQKIRAQNKRFESKLKVLDNGCFKKLGQLSLAGIMSELTVEDWEDLTEKEMESFKDRLKKQELTGEDFEMEGGKLKRRKVRTMFRVKGRAFSEKFTTEQSKRRFDSMGKNTLIEKKELRGVTDSFIPVVPEYIWSHEYIERGGIPDVYAKGLRMLTDDKDLKFAKTNAMFEIARIRNQEDPQGTQFDMQKGEKEYVRVAGGNEDDWFKGSDPRENKGKIALDKAKELLASTTQQEPVQAAGSPTGGPSVPENLEPKQAPTMAGAEQRLKSPLQGMAGSL